MDYLDRLEEPESNFATEEFREWSDAVAEADNFEAEPILLKPGQVVIQDNWTFASTYTIPPKQSYVEQLHTDWETLSNFRHDLWVIDLTPIL